MKEQTTLIAYDPTPANGRQLRQWAKDSMNLVLRDPARREMPEPEGHGAAEWEVQIFLPSVFDCVSFWVTELKMWNREYKQSTEP